MKSRNKLNRPHARFPHVYAIVRIDLPLDQDNPENSLSVVKALLSETLATDEASRLSKINADKNCNYVVFTSRLVR